MKVMFKFLKNTSVKLHLNFFSDKNLDEEYLDILSHLNYRIISKPLQIPDCAIREGTYYIKNGGYYYIVEYLIDYNLWIELGNEKKWNGHILDFNLLPKKSEREWSEIGKCYKYLSSSYKEYYMAYIHWLDLRRIRKSVRLSFLDK